MKSLIQFLICIIITCSCANSKSRNPKENLSELDKNLKLSIYVDKDSCIIRATDCLIHLEIKNISDQKISIWNKGFWPNFKITLKDIFEKDVPLTEEGKIKLNAFNRGTEYQKSNELFLNSQEIYNPAPQINLNDIFRIEKTGLYYLEIIYADVQVGEYVSNNLEVSFVQ